MAFIPFIECNKRNIKTSLRLYKSIKPMASAGGTPLKGNVDLEMKIRKKRVTFVELS